MKIATESRYRFYAATSVFLWLQVYTIEQVHAFALLPNQSIHTCALRQASKSVVTRRSNQQNIIGREYGLHSCTNGNIISPRNERMKRRNQSSLYATPGSSKHAHNQGSYGHGYNNGNGNTFKTARESAVIVEWEPVSELERRIDEGIHYQHYNIEDDFETSTPQSKGFYNSGSGTNRANIEIESVRGVFCGIASTREEINRLKSANPDDPCP